MQPREHSYETLYGRALLKLSATPANATKLERSLARGSVDNYFERRARIDAELHRRRVREGRVQIEEA